MEFFLLGFWFWHIKETKMVVGFKTGKKTSFGMASGSYSRLFKTFFLASDRLCHLAFGMGVLTQMTRVLLLWVSTVFEDLF